MDVDFVEIYKKYPLHLRVDHHFIALHGFQLKQLYMKTHEPLR